MQVGMVLSAMLAATEDNSVLLMYAKIMGEQASRKLGRVLPALALSLQSGIMPEEEVLGEVAAVFEMAVGFWLPDERNVAALGEAPTREWLRGYLGAEACSDVYSAWSQADRVWAVYTYFCWSVRGTSGQGRLFLTI